MRIRLLMTISVLVLTFSSGCKKSDSASMTQGDDCVTANGINHGNIIPGQFIVAYKQNHSGSLISGRSRGDAMQILQKYKLAEGDLVQFIQGNNPGMVVKANPEQVRLLQADPAVESVEGDRIVALSTCFTVCDLNQLCMTQKECCKTDGRLLLYAKELAFRKRLSEVVFKPPYAADTGNIFVVSD